MLKRLKVKKINNKIFGILPNKFVIILTIAVLILFWWGTSLIFNNYISFSVINISHPFREYKTEPLLKGDVISGGFKANENFLGIVYLRFNDFIQVDYTSEDILSFKIKEKGQKDWYYFNNYRTGQFKNNLLFPFGFPVIANSQHKEYQFEIESLAGNGHNSVQLSRSEALVTGHQFNRGEILGSKKKLLNYLFEKSIYSLQDRDFLLSSTVFALPLFLYMLFLTLFIKKQKNAKKILIIFLLFLILFDIFVIKQTYLGMILVVTLLWSFCLRSYRLESSVSFTVAFILIILWSVLTFFKINVYTNKLNWWSYSFIVIGLAQLILETKYKWKNLIGYKQIIKEILKK